ncbi:hypothetical protein D3C77_228270 [compost metagenome]
MHQLEFPLVGAHRLHTTACQYLHQRLLHTGSVHRLAMLVGGERGITANQQPGLAGQQVQLPRQRPGRNVIHYPLCRCVVAVGLGGSSVAAKGKEDGQRQRVTARRSRVAEQHEGVLPEVG